ncbi:hypothetical protein GCM10010442_48180 [Kitasatospora kifunensis]
MPESLALLTDSQNPGARGKDRPRRLCSNAPPTTGPRSQTDRHMVGGVATPGLSPPAFGREVPPRTASPQSPQLRCYSLVGTAQTRPAVNTSR